MNSLQGIFIEASDEQLAAIWAACALHGFTHDSAGILSLLMLAAEPDEDEEEDEPPTTIDMLADHFAKNPAQAEALKQAGARLFGSVMNKFKPK